MPALTSITDVDREPAGLEAMRGKHHVATASPARALWALAAGAIALGAIAIGTLAIGRLAIGRARVRRLEIDELVVRRLRVTGELQVPEEPPSGGEP